MMVISRVPRRASWSTTSKHSSVESSAGRTLPARDPQCAHFRLHASVISHTTCTGCAWSKSSSTSARLARSLTLRLLPEVLLELRDRAVEVAALHRLRLVEQFLQVFAAVSLLDAVVDPDRVERLRMCGQLLPRLLQDLLHLVDVVAL